ncbi:MAG: hypothetical protein ACOYJJ_08975 [Anaerovoracaceae bacterium]|jgi:hypothetical protein
MSSKKYRKTAEKKDDYSEYNKGRSLLIKIGVVVIAVVTAFMFTVPTIFLG